MSKVSTVFHHWCFMFFIASNNITELKDKITGTVLFIILIKTSETHYKLYTLHFTINLISLDYFSSIKYLISLKLVIKHDFMCI